MPHETIHMIQVHPTNLQIEYMVGTVLRGIIGLLLVSFFTSGSIQEVVVSSSRYLRLGTCPPVAHLQVSPPRCGALGTTRSVTATLLSFLTSPQDLRLPLPYQQNPFPTAAPADTKTLPKLSLLRKAPKQQHQLILLFSSSTLRFLRTSHTALRYTSFFDNPLKKPTYK